MYSTISINTDQNNNDESCVTICSDDTKHWQFPYSTNIFNKKRKTSIVASTQKSKKKAGSEEIVLTFIQYMQKEMKENSEATTTT